MLKIGFVGSREFTDAGLIKRAVERLITLHGPFEMVSGGASGADIISEIEAVAHNLATTIYPMNAKAAYEAFGNDFKARAFGRNKWIVDASDILVCFFVTPQPSGGTLNTLNHARRKGIPIYRHHPAGWVTEGIRTA